MLEWLGYAQPAEDDVVIDLMYAGQLLRMPPEALHELGAIVARRCPADPPAWRSSDTSTTP